MGGKILEFKGERLYRKAVREGFEQGFKQGFEQGFKQGVEEGKILSLASLVKDGLLPGNFALKRAEEKYGVSAEKFKELLASADVEDERLQG